MYNLIDFTERKNNMTETEIFREIKKIANDKEHRFAFIANYILENLALVPNISIQEMAKYTYSSPATINRFTKYLKINGYKELIYIIKYYNNSFLSQKVLQDEDNNSLIYTTYHSVNNSLHKTFYLSLDQKPLIYEIISLIKKAKRIIIFALGGTYNVANDFKEKLLRVGFNVVSANDFHTGYFIAKQSGIDDICFFISYSGETKDLLKLAEIVKNNNTQTILVTKNVNSSLANIVNKKLLINSDDALNRLVSTSSRLALLFILDIIYLMLISTDLDYYQNILNNTKIPKI